MLDLIHQFKLVSERLGHRQLIFLAGEPAWCCAEADNILLGLEVSPVLWFASDKYFGQVSLGQASRQRHSCITADKYSINRFLGQEFELIIFDTFAGFNPNHIAALSGSLRGGGLFIVLCPHLSDWPTYHDPEYQHITVHPFLPEDIEGRFLTYWVDQVNQYSDLIVFDQKVDMRAQAESQLEQLKYLTSREPTAMIAESYPEQEQAIEKICQLARGKKRRPLVIKSHRGRGKSAALGRAAAELLQSGSDKIIITSPHMSSTETAFQHCEQLLTSQNANAEVERDGNTLVWNGKKLIYAAPDDLLRSTHHIELLLVDEAASIPTHMLQALLRRYDRIVFSTTTHGYEGTGRGFELRFQPILDQLAPQWKELVLHKPIRWAQDDPLERFIDQSLLLCDIAPLKTSSTTILSLTTERSALNSLAAVNIVEVNRDELVKDTDLLQRLFRLLVSAHYRTNPGDLRNLLDGPNLSIFLALAGNEILAVSVIAKEGQLADDLGKEILKGNRRPRGHLLPQILIAQLGVEAAAKLNAYRIVRIAVNADYRRQGIGQALLHYIFEQALSNRIDYIGTCFGASAELLGFWHKDGFLPVRLGSSKEKTSGLHAVTLVKLISKPAIAALNPLYYRFAEQFPLLVSDMYQTVEPEIIAALMAVSKGGGAVTLDDHDWTDIKLFAYENRNYESCVVPLWKLCCHTLSHSINPFNDELMCHLFVDALLKRNSWQQLGDSYQLSGKRDVIETLRAGVKILLV